MDSSLSHRHSFTSLQGSDAEGLCDEHEVFVNAVRDFQCTLLEQFKTNGTQDDPEEVEGDEQTAALNSGKEPYLARFAQPYPVRPIWAAMPRPAPPPPSADPLASTSAAGGGAAGAGAASGGAEGSPWASDYSCAPLVCVVLRDSANTREPVRRALCALTAHPVGLLVTVNSLAPEAGGGGGSSSAAEDRGGLLLFAAVGLRWPSSVGGEEEGRGVARRPSTSMVEGLDNHMMSRADQRQMVWAAVHQILQDEDGKLPDVVVEVFMLQDVWLYDRLFRWLTLRRGTCSLETITRQISQEELDLLVHEFGEETATHFLFVEHYTRHLRVAAAVSLLCFGLTCLSWLWREDDEGLIEDGMRAVLSFFLPVWGFHFLASWRSVASKAGFRWQGSLGSVQNSVKEVARLQSCESKEAKYTRFVRVALLSVPLMLLQLLVVLAVTTSFVCMEVYIYDVTWKMMTSLTRAAALIVYNIAFGVAFILILALFHPVSKAVTTWEKHPDPELAQWHLTTKIFGNWFLAVFLYFFVIAFCYIPFGDHIADFVAALVDGKGNFTVSVRHALEQFRPDIGRLAVDVFLFFVLQDSCRLVQIMLPVVRAAWGLGQLRGAQKGRRNKNKRTAIFLKACGMCRVLCQRGPCMRRRRADSVSGGGKVNEVQVIMKDEGGEALLPEAELSSPGKPDTPRDTPSSSGRNRLKAMWHRSATMSLLFPRLPHIPASLLPARHSGEVFVVYCFLGRMQVKGDKVGDAEEEVVMAACSLSPGGGLDDRGSDDGEEDSPHVPTRLRICYLGESASGLLEEDTGDDLGDLITLTCDRKTLAGDGDAAPGSDLGVSSVRLNIFAEVLDESGANAGASPLMRGDSICSSLWRFNDDSQGGSAAVDLEIPRKGLQSDMRFGKTGVAQLGPVSVAYAAGVVRAATHPEALEKVPRALRMVREGKEEEPGGFPCSPKKAAAEEAQALALEPQRAAPWLWWDEDLAGLFWDEVFELYAVRETFETFEIYTHLTTQFSYVVLFGIAVKIIPLLALLFTTMEVRQDQLRLLWLSRPPHPDRETMSFKGTVSVGPWYEIIKFTCHMSVAVNLLLYGLTYTGLSSVKPADWTATEWWRALALFSLCQQACFFISGMLHRTVSQLDQSTATAYLRRYKRLKKCLLEQPTSSVDSGIHRRASHFMARRQLTRAASQGLTCLI